MNKLFAKLPALVLTLVVGTMASSTAYGTITIVIENVDAAGVGFNDTTAVSPVGGNPGTTLGQQRLNAFQRAADIWGATLPNGPTITVRSSWDNTLSCSTSSGTLGSAGSLALFRNFPNAPHINTWFGSALANTLAGIDLDPANPEIRARFNPDLGTTGCLEGSFWYYGLDSTSGFNAINLVTVLLHEFSHGLGFQTFTSSSTGTRPQNFPSVYDHFLFDATTNKNWTQMTDAERVSSAINTGNLVWTGARVLADATLLNAGKDAQGRPRLHAPNPVDPGSSVSHWSPAASPNQLMEPNISANISHSVTPPQDLTSSLLIDVGWCGANCPPPPPPPSPTPTPSPPANDNFASPQLISGCSGSVTGTNIGSNKESGEPSHSPDNDDGGGSVWYQWTAPASTSVTMTTAGSNYDTLLAVYTGNAVGSLTSIIKNDDVDLGVITTSTVTFTATAGTVYKIAIDGWGDDRGNITLNWTQTNCSQPSGLQFSSASYAFSEGTGSAQLVVTRGDTAAAATVDYVTSDNAGLNECNVFNNLGSSRCDYATSIGTLRFVAGEGSKNIFIPIVDDSYAEGNETFTITLSNATGATLGSPASATVTIQDNETANGPNPIDGVDFFIRQQYIDFLGREPDPAGLAGWRNVLNNCGTTVPPPCDRIEVSAGFFRSEEFQSRGYFIYRFYSAVGRIALSPEFFPDFAKVSGFLTTDQLEANKVAYVNEFMARAEFQNKYGTTLNNPTAYVDALLQTVGLPAHPSRTGWISTLNSNNNSQTRGQVLRQLVESSEVFNKYFNEAFVIMQYFGYLRRTADASYLSWLQTMNQSGGDYRTMINGFMNSAEYRRRFGP
ncbi:MAG: DUF4214 domain-containing protein [Acidobacteriota bacterium]